MGCMNCRHFYYCDYWKKVDSDTSEIVYKCCHCDKEVHLKDKTEVFNFFMQISRNLEIETGY